MASFFEDLTQNFRALALGGPAPQSTGIRPTVNPNFPDWPTSTYALRGRDFSFFPDIGNQQRPNYVPPSTSGRVPRFYPTGTSHQLYTIGEYEKLETTGSLKKQITVGRWQAVCDNNACLQDCAEGFWEKACQIDMDTKQTTCATQFMGRCNKCGRTFHQHIHAIRMWRLKGTHS
jgi:hypothetical protein